MLIAAYTLNRTTLTKVKGKVPIELNFNKDSKIEHLKITRQSTLHVFQTRSIRTWMANLWKASWSDMVTVVRVYIPKMRKVHICQNI